MTELPTVEKLIRTTIAAAYMEGSVLVLTAQKEGRMLTRREADDASHDYVRNNLPVILNVLHQINEANDAKRS